VGLCVKWIKGEKDVIFQYDLADFGSAVEKSGASPVHRSS
jgi:hypothetical protein